MHDPFQRPRPASCLWPLVLMALLLIQALLPARGATLEDQVLDTPALLSSSSVLKDVDGRWSLQQVLEQQGASFQPIDRPFGAGYVRDVYWYRIVVSRGEWAAPTWYLQVDPAYLDDVTLHHLDAQAQLLSTHRAGDRLLGGSSAVNHRTSVFKLTLPAGDNTLLLRISTRSTMAVLPKLIPESRADGLWQREYFHFGMYYGAMLVVCIAGLTSLVFLRQPVYAAYSLYVAATAFQWFAINGFLHQVLPPQAPLLADQLIASLLSLNGALANLFYTVFLDFRRHAPWLHRIMLLSAGVMLVAATLPFVPGQHSITPVTMVLHLLVLVMSVRPLWRAWNGSRWNARLGIIAFLLSALLAGWNILTVLGLLAPTRWSLIGGQLGTLFQLLLLVGVMYFETFLARRQLLQAERAAAAARAEIETERLARAEQGHLISMIAHEIRTPVAIIDAAVQSLEVLDEQATPERTRRYERIVRAVQRMSSMLELALAQDRLEVADWHKDLGEVSLEALTHEVIQTLGAASEARVVLTVDPACTPIQADGRMLRFALLNLIDNALKYSPKGSSVSIDLLDSEQAGRPGCLWVIRDQGRGIAESDHERIFQKYFRAAETSESPGLGLGLYLVRHILKRHDGWVRAVAPAGRGACFECWLPRRQRES
ncbi:sensor histidine kinase [Sphaerotilus hippei]|nr:sensor histidine kinase [Sphaerotilus hippei]